MKLLTAWIVFLFFLPSALAEILIQCSSETDCSCTPPLRALPSKFGLDEKHLTLQYIFTCTNPGVELRPVVGLLSEAISINPLDCTPEDTAKNLYQLVQKKLPLGCGYSWKDFKAMSFKKNIKHFVEKDVALCGGPYHSMCTSAVFLALLIELKKRVKEGLISQAKFNSWLDLKGPLWVYLNDQARPDLLMTEFGLGKGKILRKADFGHPDWPQEGDVVQIWRTNNSGHSVIFAGHLKDSKGKISGLCYWSANSVTNGYGKRCEPIDDVDRMIVGRFNT